jgi:hypothetical protein
MLVNAFQHGHVSCPNSQEFLCIGLCLCLCVCKKRPTCGRACTFATRLPADAIHLY